MKKKILFGISMALVIGLSLQFNQKSPVNSVKIGKQEWTLKNLDVSTFNNGEPIPEAKTLGDWSKMENKGMPAWCYYDGNIENGKKYGKLYNWFAINDSRGIAPKGWHVATDEDWTELTTFLKDSIGYKMKSTSGWKDKGHGSNSCSFNGLPSGFRDSYGSMTDLGSYGNWWSATESGDYKAWSRSLEFNSTKLQRNNTNKQSGLSVRCVKSK